MRIVDVSNRDHQDDDMDANEGATYDASDIPFKISARSSDSSVSRVHIRKRLRETVVAADDDASSPEPKRRTTTTENTSISAFHNVLRAHKRPVGHPHDPQIGEPRLGHRLENDSDVSGDQQAAYNGYDDLRLGSVTHDIRDNSWLGWSSPMTLTSNYYPQEPQLSSMPSSHDHDENGHLHHLEKPGVSYYENSISDFVYSLPRISQPILYNSPIGSTRDYVSPSPEHATTFNGHAFDLEFEGGDGFLHGPSAWADSSSIQPQETSAANQAIQDDTQDRFAEVRLGVGMAYLIICLDNGVTTKCVVSADGEIASDKLDVEALYHEVTSLEMDPEFLKRKPTFSTYTSTDSDLDPEYSLLLLPIKRAYIKICIEDRSCQKAITVEGDNTIWEERNLTQVFQDISNLVKENEDTHTPNSLQTSISSDETQTNQPFTMETELSTNMVARHRDVVQRDEEPYPLVSQSGHQESRYLLPLNKTADLQSSDYLGSATSTINVSSEVSGEHAEQQDSKHSASPEDFQLMEALVNDEAYMTYSQGILHDR